MSNLVMGPNGVEMDADYLLIEAAREAIEAELNDLQEPEHSTMMPVFAALEIRTWGGMADGEDISLMPVTVPEWAHIELPSGKKEYQNAIHNENPFDCGECGHRTHTIWQFGGGTVEWCAACNTLIRAYYDEEDE
jgi:hypothetical protein